MAIRGNPTPALNLPMSRTRRRTPATSRWMTRAVQVRVATQSLRYPRSACPPRKPASTARMTTATVAWIAMTSIASQVPCALPMEFKWEYWLPPAARAQWLCKGSLSAASRSRGRWLHGLSVRDAIGSDLQCKATHVSARRDSAGKPCSVLQQQSDSRDASDVLLLHGRTATWRLLRGSKRGEHRDDSWRMHATRAANPGSCHLGRHQRFLRRTDERRRLRIGPRLRPTQHHASSPVLGICLRRLRGRSRNSDLVHQHVR